MTRAAAQNANGKYPVGVTIIICCHDSAGRLAPTLDHLSKQQCTSDLQWEVVVVDNRSKDETAAAARSLWPGSHSRPLRVLFEENLGLSNARIRGISEACYEYITFVDDDNWLCPGWVQIVADTFQSHPEAGMLGGRGEAVFECAPPPWFDKYERAYVVGAPAESAGIVQPVLICGAGMCIRHSAWDTLVSLGYTPILTDRQGRALTSGGDSELMLALSFMGWKAYYQPRLFYQHWIPANRLTEAYLRRLCRAFGMASVMLHLYTVALIPPAQTILAYFRRSWLWRLLGNVRMLCRSLFLLCNRARRRNSFEEVLSMEGILGAVTSLVLVGPVTYRRRRKAVAEIVERLQRYSLAPR